MPTHPIYSFFVIAPKEESLVQREEELEHQIAENEDAMSRFRLERQKEALRMLVGRRRHEDQEIVSAAFSKWVRVTMFEMEQRDPDKLRPSKDELDEMKAKWQARERELALLQAELAKTRKEMLEKQDANRQVELRLAQKIAQVEKEQLEIAKQREEVVDERDRIKNDREAMATLDKFLHRRGQELDEREKAAKKNSNGKVYSLYEQKSSQVLDEALEEERRLMEETAEMLHERESKLKDKESSLKDLEGALEEKKKEIEDAANEAEEKQKRIRLLAQQLRRKESDIEERQASLSAEYEQYQSAHTRVQQMARQLQKKEEQMSRERQRLLERLQECDALESQLSDWQHQLENASAGEGGGGVISISSNTSSTSSPAAQSPDRHFFGRNA
jgi:chromosome segregation ATPase